MYTATLTPPPILKACLTDNNITLRWMVRFAYDLSVLYHKSVDNKFTSSSVVYSLYNQLLCILYYIHCLLSNTTLKKTP